MHGLMKAAALAASMTLVPAAVQAESRSIDVEPFTEIEIASGIDARIIIGGTHAVEAESANVTRLDELIVEVRDGRLHASMEWKILDFLSFGEENRIHLTITVPSVEAIASNSGADVRVDGITGDGLKLSSSSGADLDVRNIDVDTVVLEASSGADLNVSGTCTSAQAVSSSGADLDARDLVCETVQAEASSGADAEVNGTQSVRAKASSGGNVDIYGAPADVRTDESSGGGIRMRD